MRENIGLYRGKRIDNGEWVEGFLVKKIDPLLGSECCFILVQEYDTSCIDGQPTHLRSLMTWYKVISKTAGQYTELTDKDGKKIFEGDIIKCWSEGVCARGTVQQNKGGLWIIYPAWQKCIMWGLCPDKYGRADVEIIGNIHDNPELLEGGADHV